MTTQGQADLCYSGMMTAAKVMALSGIELLENPEALRQVREEFEQRTSGRSYAEECCE